MLKTLIKKQLYECFRTYFINAKTKKARSGGAVAGMFILFGFLMVMLSLFFFGMAFMMGSSLFGTELVWMYYALMSAVAILLGTFGSVFNTFASLYLAKDNEMLLAMPIPPRIILFARMTVVYGLSLLYSGIVWVPTVLCAMAYGAATVLSVVFGIALTFIIPLFVTVLTCALGWVVALIASRIRKKSFFVVALSLLFLGGYYAFYAHMADFLNALIENGEAVGAGLRKYGNLLYQLGQAGNGQILPMVIFTAVTAALFALCLFILSKSFIRIVTRSTPDGKVRINKNTGSRIGTHSVRSTLFRREVRRFTASPTYMLNCGLGIIILPVMAVFLFVKRGDILPLLDALAAETPMILRVLPVAAINAVCLVLSLNVISTPSISLEGKQLWILRTIPVKGAEVLRAKLNLHMLLNIIPATVTAFAVCLCLRIGVLTALLATLYVCAFIWFSGATGLIIGLRRPDFEWTTEVAPIKQSLNVLLAMLANLGLIIAGSGFVVGVTLLTDAWIGLLAGTVVMGLGALALDRWLMGKGGKLFDAL